MTEILEFVQLPTGIRMRIYPGRDENVLFIIRKIIRGLAYHHDFSLFSVLDEQVLCNVETKDLPVHWVSGIEQNPEVFRYEYARINAAGLDTAWRLTFYGRTTFLGGIYPGGAQFDGQNRMKFAHRLLL